MAVLVAGWLLQLPGLAGRIAAERAEGRVELILDYDGVARLARAAGAVAGAAGGTAGSAGGAPADAAGQPAGAAADALAQWLQRFAEHGVTAVAVRERNLLRLQELGLVTVLDGAAVARVLEAFSPALPPGAAPRLPVRPDWTYVAGRDPNVGASLLRAWQQHHAAGWPAAEPRLVGPLPDGRWLLAVPAPYAHAKLVPLGYPPEATTLIRRAGLRAVAVLRDAPPVPGLRRRLRLDALAASGLKPSLVLVDGDPAPGYPDRIAEVGRAIAGLGAGLALVEDWDQLGYLTRRGARELAAAIGRQPVRVYALQPELRDRLSPQEQRERIVTSVVERRARGVYLYPLEGGPAEASLAHVAALAAGIRRAGLLPGPARPVPMEGQAAPPGPPPADGTARDASRTLSLAGALLATAAAGALAACAAAARLRLPRAWASAAALLPAAGLGAAAVVLDETRLRQAAALLAALAFPLLALECAARLVDRPPGRRPAVRGAAGAAAGVAVATAGGLLVAGILSTPEFLAVWAYFRGVKASFALPVAAAAAVLLGEGARAGQLRGLGLLAGAAAAAILATAAVARSISAEHIAAAEAAVRRLLGELFVVRPRFKEFLVGVPALVLLGSLRPPRGSPAYTLLSLAGLVGLISVVNSFAHVFTPVAVSLRRTAWGLLLGLALGGAAAPLCRRLRPCRRAPAGEEGAHEPHLG